MSDAAKNTEALPTSPCAACKSRRKKCTDNCILAPYFPQDDPEKFLLVHKVFGNGNVIRLLQDLPVEQRGEAVNSIVYEASERVQNPVHGCVGVINDLHKKVAELELQCASAEAALANITGFHEGSDPNFYSASLQDGEDAHTNPPDLDDVDLLRLWDPIWT